MTRLDEFKRLYAYNRWANERIIEAVSTLPEESFLKDMGSSFRSIRDTLVHIMSAEWVWLSRWNGTSPSAAPQGWSELRLESLQLQWAELDRALQSFVSDLSESDVDRLIAYRNTAGEPFTSRLSQLLQHVINHSTYHRGQVVTMLRQLGSSAPSTDLIAYYRMIEVVPAT